MSSHNIGFYRALTKISFNYQEISVRLNFARKAPWPSGRASDSGARGRGVRSSLRSPCCVLEQDTFTSQKVLVIPRKRWLCPDMTEKMLTGTLNLNKTKTKTSEFRIPL